MFDRYVSGSRPSWSRRAVLIASLVLHGGLGLALLLMSFFHVVEIAPPPLSIVFVSAPPPPPPGGEHATKAAATHPRPHPHPLATRAPSMVQPVAPPPVDDAPGDDSGDAPDDGNGIGGGPGGPGNGPGVPGGTGITSMPQPKPINVPPHKLDEQRLFGSDPHLPSMLIRERRGEHGLTFIARMCVDQSGNVSQVSVLQSLPGADADIIGTLRRWRYKPQPIPVCFMANFVFDVD